MRLNAENPSFGKVEALYLSAFPLSERKPFSVITDLRKAGMVEIISIEDDNGVFLGLAITAFYRDLALLDYFAIADDVRGHGIGSTALQLLKERYADKRFFIEIETTEGESENHEERVRRKAFYERNGMTVLPYVVNLFGVEMEMLSADGKEIRFEEYHQMYDAVFHKAKFVKLVREL